MKLRRLYNPIVAGILRSPLHGVMSNSVMLLTYRGRRSGRVFKSPVSYVQHGEDLLAVASRDHTWWKNLRGGAPVKVRVRGRELRGTGRALESEASEEDLLKVLRSVPTYPKHWGAELDEGGRPTDPAVLAWIVRENVVVKLGNLTKAEIR